MRRRAHRYGRPEPPSQFHSAFLWRARFPPTRHPSSPSLRRREPGTNEPVERRRSLALPPPGSTAPSRARCKHAPCPPHRNESSLQRTPSEPRDQIRPREMANAQKDKPRAGVELRKSFARKRQPSSAPLLHDHPDPCLRESRREISLFVPTLLSRRIRNMRGRLERKRILARVPGSDPKPSALWPRLACSPADRRSCKRPWVRAD